MILRPRSKSVAKIAKEHQVISVEIRIIFLKLGSILTKENKFSCEAFMEASWIDRNFSAIDQDGKKIKYSDKLHWYPRLYIQNIISSSSQETWYHIEPTSSIGTRICERRRIKGEFSHTFSLKCFPLDIQELTISVSTFRSSHDVCLIMNKDKKSSIHQSAFTQTHEWILSEDVCNMEATKPSDYSSKRHCVLDISVCVNRKTGYFFWNAFFFMLSLRLVWFWCF